MWCITFVLQFHHPSMILQCGQQSRTTFDVILLPFKSRGAKISLLLVNILMNQGHIPEHIGLLVKFLTMSHRCRLVGCLAVNPKLSIFAGIPAFNQECAMRIIAFSLQELGPVRLSVHAGLIWKIRKFFKRAIWALGLNILTKTIVNYDS